MNLSTEYLKFKNTDFLDNSLFKVPTCPHRKAKIMVTLDDPNISVVDIKKMMEAGVNIARLVLPAKEDHFELMANIDKAATILASKRGVLSWPCATALDLTGCAVKTGHLENARVQFIKIIENDEIIITHDPEYMYKCNNKQIYVDNPYLIKDTIEGMELSISKNTIVLTVLEKYEVSIKCKVKQGGLLGNCEQFNMKGALRNRPYITKHDLEIVQLSSDYQVNIMIVNYARSPKTVHIIEQYLGDRKRPYIVSGISTSQGIANLDDLIAVSDAILIPRDSLAFELKPELFGRMQRIQKMIIGKCRLAGKPVLISGGVFRKTLMTGIMDSRDASDVTSALLEGVSGFILDRCKDADMLIQTVKYISELCGQVEPCTCDIADFNRLLSYLQLPANAAMTTAMSCVLLANKIESQIIIIPTVSGRTIYYLNYLRPLSIILAVTTSQNSFQLMQAYRSVLPLLFEDEPRRTWHRTVAVRVEFALKFAVQKSWIRTGNSFVTLEKGLESSSFCDTVKVEVVQSGNEGITCPPTPVPTKADLTHNK